MYKSSDDKEGTKDDSGSASRGGGWGGGREGEGAKGDARDATSVVLAEGIDLHHLRSVLCKAD
jgi:hypothetical protein